jgi:hypothetical protein
MTACAQLETELQNHRRKIAGLKSDLMPEESDLEIPAHWLAQSVVYEALAYECKVVALTLTQQN